jgi:His-Xaa-Ser system radical SAM maturase HxsC
MLLKLSASGLRPVGVTSSGSMIVRVVDDPRPSAESLAHEALLVREPDSAPPPGFRAYLLTTAAEAPAARDTYVLDAAHAYLAPGDVVRIDPRRRSLTALHRAASSFNTFVVTERCDNLCVMCSQPPKARNDAWLVDDLERAIPLISKDAAEIGISGGEPALLGDRLVELLARMRDHLPRTAVHLLSNGRRFADRSFARAVARVGHPDLMVGVPLYGDLGRTHDYVVQRRGAFDETVMGILELKRQRVRVEVRTVVHAGTVGRLGELAQFVARNLTFVDHVALMGLELVGFARSNVDELWVDPVDYTGALVDAVATLARAGMAVSVYNHQLCTIDPSLWPYARRSVSDWKNVHHAECAGCAQRGACGGFFESSLVRRSRGIRALGAE